MRAFTFLVAAGMLAICVHASPDHRPRKNLTGTYTIGTASLTDPGAAESKTALLRLHITGEVAKDLFNTLRSPPERDVCFDDGTMTRSSGAILCARHPKGAHECWIGVDIHKPALAPAFVC